MEEKNIGSSFDSWLRDEGLYEEITARSIRRVTARQNSEGRMSMEAKEDARALIGRAERATTGIQDHARRAVDALRRGLATDSAAVNSLGVLMEPRLRENDLVAARAEIDAALETFRNTAWPGESDYSASGLS